MRHWQIMLRVQLYLNGLEQVIETILITGEEVLPLTVIEASRIKQLVKYHEI